MIGKIKAEVLGKFILMCREVIQYRAEHVKMLDEFLYQKIGVKWTEIDPEKFYPCEIFNAYMRKYGEISIAGREAIMFLGTKVYPLIKKTTNMLDHIKTPLEMILFEAEGFRACHRGPDVRERTFIRKEPGHVRVSAPAPGYDQKLYEGVFRGILKMFPEVTMVLVTMDTGYPDYIYDIRWEEI